MNNIDFDSAYELSLKDIQYLTRLMEIIESRDWKVFVSIIISSPIAFQTFARSIARSSQLNGMTILHACVRYNPPPSVVRIILGIHPESLTSTDFSLRTPLHVAVGMQARQSTVEILVNSYPDACMMQDLEGKTPLHLACDGACKLFESSRHAIRTPRFEVISTLIHAHPESVQVVDRDGMSPLEYAIVSDASIKVVEFLQIATRIQCEKLLCCHQSLSGSWVNDKNCRMIDLQ